MRQNGPLLLLDVRPKDQFEITHLPNALNVDWERTFSKCNKIEEILPADFDKQQDEVYIMCRYGNDSQLAAKRLMLEFGLEKVYDVKGGINKWSCEVDKNVPIY
ncbi:hypothetical protein HF325_001599 [Metschnikowia pulcherrima]|uniref:Rhodanese domain-containing protein n=1 Tax=Metschnikowia pulcherrima TaxID=27326 RepID=A0A8H7LBP5_9ASCO|nr:hypothetical protein HF325_001599 [Metschnikowia pulcherrima]